MFFCDPQNFPDIWQRIIQRKRGTQMRENGREKGILSGANVVMPNLSPEEARSRYMLYNNKLNTGVESAEKLEGLKKRIRAVGYEIVTDRGDIKK